MSSYVSNETLNVQIPHSTVAPIKFWIHYLWSPTLYLPRLRYSIQHTALVPHFLEALIFLNHQAHYLRCHWWFMTLMVRSIHFPRQCWVVFFSKISHKWYLWFHWTRTKIFFCVVKFWIFRVLYIVRREQRKDIYFFFYFFEKYTRSSCSMDWCASDGRFLWTRMKIFVIHKSHYLLVAKKPTILLSLSSSPSSFSSALRVSLVLVIIAKKDEWLDGLKWNWWGHGWVVVIGE